MERYISFWLYIQNAVGDAMLEIKRVKTYVQGLDEHMEGGIPIGSVSLISGTPGSMKSSLAYSILYNNVLKEGLKGLYITLEQDINSLKQQMEKLKMNHEDTKEKLVIVDYNMMEEKVEDRKFKLNWMKKIGDYIKYMKEKEDYDLVVIDSLDALYALATIKEPRTEIYHFFKGLRETGMTSLLISEMRPNKNRFSYYGVEDFLSDGIMHVEFQKRGDILSSLERYMGVVKMRSTDHDTQYFPILYTGDRFTVFGREELELE
jgi:KaiC/GvpD/RAD55 family RecA-like ATPase